VLLLCWLFLFWLEGFFSAQLFLPSYRRNCPTFPAFHSIRVRAPNATGEDRPKKKKTKRKSLAHIHVSFSSISCKRFWKRWENGKNGLESESCFWWWLVDKQQKMWNPPNFYLFCLSERAAPPGETGQMRSDGNSTHVDGMERPNKVINKGIHFRLERRGKVEITRYPKRFRRQPKQSISNPVMISCFNAKNVKNSLNDRKWNVK
jgi:hypothetical protein